MSKTTTACAACGGKLVPKRITVDRRIGERLMMFEDVPARVCDDCAQVWLAGQVIEAMDGVMSGGEKIERTIAVPAFSLSRLHAA